MPITPKVGVGFRRPQGTVTAWYHPGMTPGTCPPGLTCKATLDTARPWPDYSGRYYGGGQQVGMPIGHGAEDFNYNEVVLRWAWDQAMAGSNVAGLVSPEAHDGNPIEQEKNDLAYTVKMCSGLYALAGARSRPVCNVNLLPKPDPLKPMAVLIPHEGGLWRYYTRPSLRFGGDEYYRWIGWQEGMPLYSPRYPHVFEEEPTTPEEPIEPVEPVEPSPPPPDDTVLVLHGGRFLVNAQWRIPDQGLSGAGRVFAAWPEAGDFWFLYPNDRQAGVSVLVTEDDPPVKVKIYDYAGSNVLYRAQVIDTVENRMYRYPPDDDPDGWVEGGAHMDWNPKWEALS